MTLVYIHGVTVRDPAHGRALEAPFRRWLSPCLQDDAGPNFEYEPVYWGGAAASFRWNLASRPPTAILGMGAEDYAALGVLRGIGERLPPGPAMPVGVDDPVLGAGPLIDADPGVRPTAAPPLSRIDPNRRPDMIADLYLAVAPAPKRDQAGAQAGNDGLGALASAAAQVAERWDAIMAEERDDDARAARLVHDVDALLRSDGVIAQGGLQAWMEKAGEALRRAASWPGDAASSLLGELRPTANQFVAYFVGDVFSYLATREGAAGVPGPIPDLVLAALRRGRDRRNRTGEPLIVLTHSMGGQLLYDAVTHFAAVAGDLDDLVVDHWVTFGSQVSFFAELGLFEKQPDTRGPDKLPKPDRIKRWTNFYDRNDLFGFVMEPVFRDVKDLEYNTGYGLALAHTGFLARPSFFEELASTIGPRP